MEYVLSFLKSHFELWQSCSSIFIDSNLNYTLISGLGLIFLYLSYLVLKLFFTTIWKTKTIEKVRDYGWTPREILMLLLFPISVLTFLHLILAKRPGNDVLTFLNEFGFLGEKPEMGSLRKDRAPPS